MKYVLLLIFSAIIVFFVAIITTKKRKNAITLNNRVEDFLISKKFYPKRTILINQNQALSINKNEKIIAVISIESNKKNTSYTSKEISLSEIKKIEQSKNSIVIIYKENEKILIQKTKETTNTIYNFFKKSKLTILKNTYPNNNIDICTTSDWENNFLWAYDNNAISFIYYKTSDRKRMHRLKILKEHFIIDLKYLYFELPILGQAQQLYLYENTFLKQLYNYLYKNLLKKCTQIYKNEILYDSFNNILYIANNNMLASIILTKIKDIIFSEDKISFLKIDDNKTSNIYLNQKQQIALKKFITEYNLKKIKTNFNYDEGKLINTAEDTKLYLNINTKRLIYNINLTSLLKFKYIAINFDEINTVESKKSGQINYVRITLQDNKILDITCNKKEIAEYIENEIKVNIL